MAYVPITDAEDDPEAPATSFLAKRWKNNPIAIAQRDSGAPRVKPSSIEELTGSGNWVVPDGVTRVKVTAVGGGGSGVSATDGGGGGGTVVGTVEVTPGDPIPYVVGPGGSDSDGGDTTFDGGAVVTAEGGEGHGTGSAGGGGSGTSADVIIPGSSGGSGTGPAGAFGGDTVLAPGMHLAGVGYFPGGGGAIVIGANQDGADGTIILEY